VQRASDTIGNLAAALAKAQLEFVNPGEVLGRHHPSGRGQRGRADLPLSGICQRRSHPMRGRGVGDGADRPIRGDPLTGGVSQHGRQIDRARGLVDRRNLHRGDLMPQGLAHPTLGRRRVGPYYGRKPTGCRPIRFTSGQGRHARRASDAKPVVGPEASTELRDRLFAELSALSDEMAIWARRKEWAD